MGTLSGHKARLAKQRQLMNDANKLRNLAKTYQSLLLETIKMHPTYEVRGVFGYISEVEYFIDEDTGEVVPVTRSRKVTRHDKLCNEQGIYLKDADLLHEKFDPTTFWHPTVWQKF
jgi:hypothetical protein